MNAGPNLRRGLLLGLVAVVIFSATLPITRLDGKPIGEGRPGPLVARLRAAYLQSAGRAPDALEALP